MAKIVDEFKTFALRGNVVDLAVGVIIGAAFSRIVSSLVDDVFTPVLGAVTGGLDFTNYFLPLSPDVTATTLAEARAEGAVIAYGSFLTAAINFLLVAWVLFLLIRAINRLRALQDRRVETPPAPPEIPPDVKLLSEIRDLLAEGADPARKKLPEGPKTD